MEFARAVLVISGVRMFKRKDNTTLTKTFEYKLRVNRKFVERAEEILSACRLLYNCALEQRISHYQYGRKSLTYFDQQAELTLLRSELPEVKAIGRSIQVNVLRRLEKSYRAFFERVKLKKLGLRKGKAGFPRFKSSLRYNSFSQEIEKQRGCPLAGDKLTVPSVGTVRVRLHRPLEGVVKELRILRRVDGWYVQLVCEIPQPAPLPTTGRSTGVDVNLLNLATLSDGTEIPNHRFAKQNKKKLKKAQQKLNRKEKGSANREKARRKVARIHLHTSRCRKDVNHKVSHDLVRDYDATYWEDLNVAGLAKNSHLSFHIHDAGWRQLRDLTGSKAASAGRLHGLRNPSWTSQTCSHCGYRQPMPLSERTFCCERCGLILPRDQNAARNIEVGLGNPKLTPVENVTSASRTASARKSVRGSRNRNDRGSRNEQHDVASLSLSHP